jgi:hypothetical protein
VVYALGALGRDGATPVKVALAGRGADIAEHAQAVTDCIVGVG